MDGKTIDLAPDYTFDSPFMREDWATGVVRIARGGRELIIDVN